MLKDSRWMGANRDSAVFRIAVSGLFISA